jgi:hypothetical protein
MAHLTEAGLAMRAKVSEISLETALASGMSLAEADGLRTQLSRLTESLDAAVERLTTTHPNPA